MRRVSKGAWLAIAFSMIASLASVVSLFALAHAPPVAHRTAPTRDDVHRRLAIASADGVLVVESDGAYRIGADLMRRPVQWYRQMRTREALGEIEYLSNDKFSVERPPIIDAISSVSWTDGVLRFIAVCHGERYLFTVADNRASWQRADSAIALHRQHLITRDGDALYDATDEKQLPVAHNIQLDAVEGITWIDGVAHLLVGERGAHWLITLDGHVLPMPGGGYTIWSPSMTLRPGKSPFLDEHGVAHAYESGTVWPAFTVGADGELEALPLSRSLDESGVLETAAFGRRLQLRTHGRRLQTSTTSHIAWTSIASIDGPYEFAAFPLPGSEQFLALNDDGSEALLLDGNGRPLRVESVAATVAALSGHPLSTWFTWFGLLAALGLLLPLAVVRTVRALAILDEQPVRPDRPDARGVFFGALHVPPGAVVTTGRAGRVQLPPDCQLRSGGVALQLSPGPVRIDGAGDIPLVDGEPVYLVGRVRSDDAGGPMRASHRKQLTGHEGRYFIGRGGRADFERHLLSRENAALARVALVHLAFGLSLLLALGLKPFA